MKTAHDIEKYWKNESPAFSKQYASFFGIPLTPVGLFLRARFKKITEILKSLPGDVMVDVGCGSGIFIAEGVRLGKYVYGFDYSEQMLSTAKQYLSSVSDSKYKLARADAAQLPLKNDTCDILLASGLTDYLTSNHTKKFLQETTRVLKKGGYAIITFPNSDSPFAFLRSGFGLKVRRSLLKLPPLETVYSQQLLKQQFVEVGLKPVRWDEVLFTMHILVGKKI